MIAALVYLQIHSLKNRIRSQVRRLRKPKYLAGGLVGVLYIYFFFLRQFLFQRGPFPMASSNIPGEYRWLVESLAAGLLLVIVMLSWITPHQRAALAFTEAEIAFLFPAPISRRGLIHFKLLRSQVSILFTTLFLTLFSGRFGMPGTVWIRAAGWWLVLSTLNLHFLGSSFAMTWLLDLGVSKWLRRFTILAGVALLSGGVIFWAWWTLPAPTGLADFKAAGEYLRTLLESGPVPWLLFPFRVATRPFLARDGAEFLAALWPALVLMALHYGWVVRSNVAFEEASLELSRQRAERMAAARSGNWHLAGRIRRQKRPPFRLAPSGSPIGALLWKNLISTGQRCSVRFLISMAVMISVMSFAVSATSRGFGWQGILGMIALVIAAGSMMMGPQILQQDFRQDLPLADVLKTYPVRGWQMVLGELLAPVAVLTGGQWLLLLMAGILLGSLGSLPGKHSITPQHRLAFGVGIAILMPAINLVSFLISNAAVLYFPGWFPAGQSAARGIEATGQRLIFMVGQLLGIVLALLPAVVAGTVVFLICNYLLGLLLAVPLTALAGAGVLGAEAGLGVWWLGRVFERFDVSSEPTV